MSDRVLYVLPSAVHSDEPVEDGLTRGMEALLTHARPGPRYRGVHTAECGARSTNRDYQLPDGTWTNSRAPHYLRWHRAEIPEADLAKVAALIGL